VAQNKKTSRITKGDAEYNRNGGAGVMRRLLFLLIVVVVVDRVSHVCGGGSGCAGGGVPLGAMLVLSCFGKVSLGGILILGRGNYALMKHSQ